MASAPVSCCHLVGSVLMFVQDLSEFTEKILLARSFLNMAEQRSIK